MGEAMTAFMAAWALTIGTARALDLQVRAAAFDTSAGDAGRRVSVEVEWKNGWRNARNADCVRIVVNAAPRERPWGHVRLAPGGHSIVAAGGPRGNVRAAEGGVGVTTYIAGVPPRPWDWISWNDALAFADWARLRSVTELEFTKAGRGPGTRIAHEYPWGTATPAQRPDPSRDLRRIAGSAPGTLGVRVVHVETGAAEGVNDQDWYPMMSAYKLPIAIHALRQAERQRLDLTAMVTLGSSDRRPGFSPLARTIEKKGPQAATLRDLLSAIVRVSDNTASDRLLREAGGPAAVAATLRELQIDGVDVSRYEAEFAADYHGVTLQNPFSLEELIASIERTPVATRRRAAAAFVTDRRDAAQPRAFADMLVRLVKGELLNRENTAWLLNEMTEMHARDTRLRAGLPPGTLVGLRPGTSGERDGVRAAHNDNAVVTLPDGTHLVIAAFLKGAKGTDADRDGVLASVARIAYQWAHRNYPTFPARSPASTSRAGAATRDASGAASPATRTATTTLHCVHGTDGYVEIQP